MIMSMKSKWLVNKGICLYLLLDFTYYQNTVEPILSKKVGNIVYDSDMRGFLDMRGCNLVIFSSRNLSDS